MITTRDFLTHLGVLEEYKEWFKNDYLNQSKCYTKSLMDFSLDEALNNTDIPFALVIGFIWIRNKAKVNWSSIHSKALHLETLRKHYKNPDNTTNSL